jgi:hypothetical protein
MNLHLPSSSPQTEVASRLDAFRRLFLQQALAQTIGGLELPAINGQLDAFAPPADLKKLASRGVRGEFVFAVPCILLANPRLLGYYRLLLGFSQKELYNKSKLGRFKCLEEKGVMSARTRGEINDLCEALCVRASELIKGVGVDRISLDLLDDLTLLTLGPQLRGSNNTEIGRIANTSVFNLIQSIVGHAVENSTLTRLEVINASNRLVRIAFSADPDISIVEAISSHDVRNIVAIEIKGGADQSNIWNRLGEAEKSHQSAKQRGFVEFWTIVNVPTLDEGKAREKSPTTNRFYILSQLLTKDSPQFNGFRDRLVSLVGIAAGSYREEG